MNSRSFNRTILILAAMSTTLSYQNCSRVSFTAMSLNEAGKLGDEPFVFDENKNVAGVQEADGHPSENLRVASVDEAAKNFVQDCSKPVETAPGVFVPRFDYERDQALAAAKADPDQKTIPVEFALSFGQKEDRLAYWAHTRAILSEDNDSDTSIIPVGPKDNSMYVENKTSYDAYYLADHSKAKQNYIYGKNCFFDTVKLKSELVKKIRANANDRYDFITKSEANAGTAHLVHYMFYGWCAGAKCATEKSAYGKGSYGADTYPNRLFAAWPHNEAGAPQIVKLYVADLRDGHFGLSTTTNKIVRIPEQAERGAELQMDVKKELDLKTVFRNRGQVIRNLSSTYTSPTTKEVFKGMKGVPQLLSNLMLAGMNGTVLASQYTPIVLDLGSEKVKTSSAFGGSFFDMAATAHPHQTAWLGGDLIDVAAGSKKISTPILTTPDAGGTRGLASIDDFKVDVRRVSDDGFLVIPNADGSITSSKNLFGDKTEVEGKTFANGFLALQALSKKDCLSLDYQKRYFGPWDGSLYTDKVKVWVDANRNGVADAGELKSLHDAGVVALNTCNVINDQHEDAFGNGTSMRAAFLFQDGEDITGNETEIFKRLESGKTSDGKDASFRLAIDLIFKVNESLTFE